MTTPRKRKLWNQVELISEIKKLTFVDDAEKANLFNECWLLMSDTNCTVEEAIDKLRPQEPKKLENVFASIPEIDLPTEKQEQKIETELLSMEQPERAVPKRGKKVYESK